MSYIVEFEENGTTLAVGDWDYSVEPPAPVLLVLTDKGQAETIARELTAVYSTPHTVKPYQEA